ncbi:DNA polymerase III subunit beta [Fusibacter sp. JL298sf-3]
MIFKCHQSALSTAINIVSKAVSSKTTLPILAGIYFESIPGGIKLIGNDLNLSIETQIEAQVEREGAIVMPSRLISELIKKLPDADIEFVINDNNVVDIHCMNSSYKLIGLPGNEYPELPIIEDKNAFQMDKELFSNMIRQTSFAISQDEARPILTGALLEIENGKFNMVAIDGYRMAIKNAVIKTDLSQKVVVPGRTLNEISKLVSQFEHKNDLKIAFDEKQVLFTIHNVKVYSRLLAGEFINYNQILPTEYKSVLTVKTDDLFTCLDRSFLMARENKNVAIRLDIKDDQLKIISNSEMGSAVETLPIGLEGQDLEIGFNPKFLIDALKVIESDEIQMHFVNNVSPCIIKPVDTDNYTYLVLPCRIAK